MTGGIALYIFWRLVGLFVVTGLAYESYSWYRKGKMLHALYWLIAASAVLIAGVGI